MRKHNEGYALPLVLVVMVVICIIALSVMSFTLRGLKSQHRAIESMQARYEAQGELEKITAKICGTSGVVEESATLDLEYDSENKLLTVRVADSEKMVWIEATLLLSGGEGFNVGQLTNEGSVYYSFAMVDAVKYVAYQIITGEVGQ